MCLFILSINHPFCSEPLSGNCRPNLQPTEPERACYRKYFIDFFVDLQTSDWACLVELLKQLVTPSADHSPTTCIHRSFESTRLPSGSLQEKTSWEVAGWTYFNLLNHQRIIPSGPKLYETIGLEKSRPIMMTIKSQEASYHPIKPPLNLHETLPFSISITRGGQGTQWKDRLNIPKPEATMTLR